MSTYNEKVDYRNKNKKPLDLKEEVFDFLLSPPTVIMGIMAVSALAAYAEHGHIGVNTHAPVSIEKSGGHQGASYSSKPGEGLMHTKSGDFHVAQSK